jgi:5'-3' exonuclease
MTTEAKPILLIDLSAIFWPAWHAGEEGEGIEAHDRTLSKCRKLAQGYEVAAVCVDAGDSGRKKLYPQYKANRSEKPAASIEQLRRVAERLGRDGFHVLRGAGFEADDTIATAVHWAKSHAAGEVVIACADKDLLQLVNDDDGVRALSLSSGDEIREAGVYTKFGVVVTQLADYLALVGDKSDNILGCPGIGAKTVAKLLQEWNTLEGIAEAVESGDEGSGKTAENLREYLPRCLAAREIIRLRTDAPVDCSVLLAPAEQVAEAPPAEAPPEEGEPEAEPVAAEVVDPGTPEEIQAARPVAKTAAVAVRTPAPAPVPFARQLEPTSLRMAFHIAEAAIQSRGFGGYPTPQAAYLAVIAGRERGLGAISSLRGHFVFDGNLGMYSQLVVAEILRSGLADFFRPILEQCDRKGATWETRRKGEDRTHVYTFTIEDAQKRGLAGKSNYQKQPDTMLRWRCAAELGRAIYPDVVGGVYTEADIGDEMAKDLQIARSE